ncbi:MAG: glycosyltransferase [Planctomycetota bacterium]
MRVIHLIPFFEPTAYVSGPVTITKHLGNVLNSRGHTVRVVTSDYLLPKNIPRDRWLDRDGLRVWYASGGWLGRRPPFLVRSTRVPLRESLADADLLHMTVGLTWMNRIGASEARRAGVPYLCSPRGVLSADRLRSWSQAKRVFARLVDAPVLRGAHAVHALTEAEEADVIRLGASRERIHRIPNAVGADVSTSEQRARNRLAMRREWGLTKDTKVVLYLSRLLKIKGIYPLVDAFARVSSACADLHLVMVGPDDEDDGPPLRGHITRLGIEKRVTLAGPCTTVDRPSILHAADIFTLPSFAEGMPNVVLEAMAHGLPVLITPGCHLPEVADANAGLIVEPTPALLARSLIESLDDTEGLEARGRNGRELVRQKFTFSRIVTDFERAYRSAKERFADDQS